MSDASSVIAQQWKDGSVIPAPLPGQNSVSKTYVDGQDAKIERKADKAQSDISSHISSFSAHASQNITYNGKALGSNVKQAIDNTYERISGIVAQAGNDNTEIVDARGGYHVLRERLNATDQRLLDIAVNVKSYGALGDGVTDDTAAIQTAIDDAIGRVLLFPAGTYIISDALVLQSNSHVKGEYGKSIIKQADNNPVRPGSMMYVDGWWTDYGKENVVIEGLVFDANAQNNFYYPDPEPDGNFSKWFQNNMLCAVAFTATKNIQLLDCIVRNCPESGVWINECTGAVVKNNTFHDCRTVGFAFKEDVDNIKFTGKNLILDGNTAYNCTVGLQLIFGVIHCNISNNICYNNKDEMRFPSYAFAGTYPDCYPHDIRFNRPDNPDYVNAATVGDGSGIELTSAGIHNVNMRLSNRFVNINGNNCFKNMIGIRVEGNSGDISINGNTSVENEADGVFVFDAKRVSIVGNYLSYNQRNGLRLEKITEWVVDNCNISGNSILYNDKWGVSLIGTYSAIVANNNISGNNRAANSGVGEMSISKESTTYQKYSVISNNVFVNADGRAEWALHYDEPDYHSDNVISDNVFHNYNSPTNVSVYYNQVTGNKGFTTSNFGSAIIQSGQTSVTVNHGLSSVNGWTPWQGQLSITPTKDIGEGNRYWVDSPSTTSFVIHIGKPLAYELEFWWKASEDKQ